MYFITSSIALGSPHRSFTSQGLAPITTNRPWQSRACALPIVTTNITPATTVATLITRLIVHDLPRSGVDELPETGLRLPNGSEPCGDRLGLLEICPRRAPAEQDSRDVSARQKHPELCDEADDAVCHRSRVCTIRDRHASDGML